jgi:serine/threonine protein kinase
MGLLKDTVLKNQYFLRELVGSGGMADVYLAWDKLRSAKMAVKVLRSDLAGNAKFYKAFEKEAHLLEELQHPYIVRLYEFDREKDIVFLVMAWVSGVDLKKRITNLNRPLSLPEISQVLQPICSALHFAHQKKAYHCDIKPSNILLHENGNDVFLADFGVARVAREQAGGGTLPYMAPEQFIHGSVGAQTDIYALGITVYEMLSGGVLPYRGGTDSPGTTTRDRFAYEHNYLPMPSPLQFNPAIPQGIVTVIQKALNKNQEDRYSSALEFLHAFEQASANVQAVASAKEYQTRLEPPTVSISLTKSRGGVPSTTGETAQTGNVSPVKLSGPYLFVRSGEKAGQSIPILPHAGMTIGRGASCHLRFTERSVSRQHAVILVGKKGTYIRDDGSALGTFLNGNRIPANVPMPLKHGDVVRIGYLQMLEFRKG